MKNIIDSTTKAKYVSASVAIWLCKFLQDLEMVPLVIAPLKLFCDKNGTVARSKKPINYKKQKHIREEISSHKRNTAKRWYIGYLNYLRIKPIRSFYKGDIHEVF